MIQSMQTGATLRRMRGARGLKIFSATTGGVAGGFGAFLFAVVAWLWLGGPSPLAAAELRPRPNIIFLFADDQRPDAVGALGNPHIHTPNLDRLKSEGFLFRRNYCAGSYSGAVCVASRSMLMTGRQWMRIEDKADWTGLPLFPQLLGQAGYQTFMTGKWHNGPKTLGRAFQSGKAIFMGGMADHTRVPLQDLTAEGELVNRRTEGFSSEVFADAAIDFLRDHASKDQPFFLYVAFTAPHDPRNPPPPYRQRYYDQRPPLPPNYAPLHPFDNGTAGGLRDEWLAPWPRERSVISDQLCEYYGLVTHLDEQVGRIFKALDESGLADNTYIIYTADHGLAMGSHGLLGKQNIYEHSMRSPLMVKGPEVPAGGESEALVYIFDLFRTVCLLAGVTPPDEVDAQDLAPIWRGQVDRVRDSLFLPYQDLMRGVTDGRWKLHCYPSINHQMLFDLQADPHEMNDLARAAEHQATVERLTALMKDWQARLGDDLPLRVQNPKAMQVDYEQARLKRTVDKWQPKWIRDKYFDGQEYLGN